MHALSTLALFFALPSRESTRASRSSSDAVAHGKTRAVRGKPRGGVEHQLPLTRLEPEGSSHPLPQGERDWDTWKQLASPLPSWERAFRRDLAAQVAWRKG